MAQGDRTFAGDGHEATDTLDPEEVARFAAMAQEWWDADGKFAPLHRLNPVRLTFIRDEICRHFGRDGDAPQPFSGLRLLDIGCGGGLLSEPMARLGAEVTGIDPAKANVAAARAHAQDQGLTITYRIAQVEDLVAEGAQFDVVLNMEVLEHVPSITAFLRESAKLLAPEGLMLMSTLNRTWKSFALAIVGAEYILRWLPAGTHQWDRFITPEELRRALAQAGLAQTALKGMVYSPFSDSWRLDSDTDVNYLAAARHIPS